MANTKANPTTVRVTVNEVAQYLALQEKRRALLREADSLKRIEAALAWKFIALAKEHGGRVPKGKYVLALHAAAGRVSWKTEFIHALGEAAAKRVAAKQPVVTTLSVTGG